MRGLFAGALLASALIHAGVLLSPAPWVGARQPAEGKATLLSVRLNALPDLKVAELQPTAGRMLDVLPAESPKPDMVPAFGADPVFYKSSELDKTAWPVGGIPQLAMLVTDPSHQWRLRARLLIDETGKVIKVDVVGVQTATDDLAVAVAATLKTISFSPAVKDGKNVRSQKLMDLAIGGDQ
ncbi:MAG: hypothetical protein Q8N51_03220 [Gammaproteobacteria bacterium]|nr:hypothetical protein [Gammaproteobacteria bacterium]